LGAPVSDAFAEKIGADGCGKDAVEAVRVAGSLI
jgi:methanogenic corrinoid protein MtbC1